MILIYWFESWATANSYYFACWASSYSPPLRDLVQKPLHLGIHCWSSRVYVAGFDASCSNFFKVSGDLSWVGLALPYCSPSFPSSVISTAGLLALASVFHLSSILCFISHVCIDLFGFSCQISSVVMVSVFRSLSSCFFHSDIFCWHPWDVPPAKPLSRIIYCVSISTGSRVGVSVFSAYAGPWMEESSASGLTVRKSSVDSLDMLVPERLGSDSVRWVCEKITVWCIWFIWLEWRSCGHDRAAPQGLWL